MAKIMRPQNWDKADLLVGEGDHRLGPGVSMTTYEAPHLEEIGSLEQMTQGNWQTPGSDWVAHIPLIGPILDQGFGS